LEKGGRRKEKATKTDGNNNLQMLRRSRPQETFNIIKTNVCGIFVLPFGQVNSCLCVGLFNANIRPTHTQKHTNKQYCKCVCASGSWQKCRKSFRQSNVAQKNEESISEPEEVPNASPVWWISQRAE